MKRTVLMVTGSAPPDTCGVGDYTSMLVSSLLQAGQPVELLCHRDWTLRGTSRALKKMLASGEALIHMQYPTMGYGYSLGPQLCLMSRQGVVTLHEFSLAHPLRKASLVPFTLRSSRVIMTSEFERRALAQKMPWVQNRIRVIPIGSNIPALSSEPTVRRESVVYFGLVMPRKGIEEFLEFARIVRANNLDWELLVIGKIAPGQDGYAESLMGAMSSCKVQLVLDRGAEEVSKMLSSGGLGYLPFPDGASERRGSLKAALVCGLPCITTVSDQTPRDLERAVVKAANPKEAFEAAIRLMNAPSLRATLSENAGQYAQQFTWEKIAASHIGVYRELSKP